MRENEQKKAQAARPDGRPGSGFQSDKLHPASSKLPVPPLRLQDLQSKKSSFVPKEREEETGLLGIDLSIWSGLATTCFLPEKVL